MSHTPLTSGALARMSQVAILSPSKAEPTTSLSERETLSGRKCSRASASDSWPEGDRRQWPEEVTTSEMLDFFNLLPRFRMLLNDGEYSNNYTMLATQVKLGAVFSRHAFPPPNLFTYY